MVSKRRVVSPIQAAAFSVAIAWPKRTLRVDEVTAPAIAGAAVTVHKFAASPIAHGIFAVLKAARSPHARYSRLGTFSIKAGSVVAGHSAFCRDPGELELNPVLLC